MAKETFKFEEAIKRLEQIVSSLESGEVALDEALKLFQEGVGLVKACDEKLKKVEEKATKILEGEVEKDFKELD
ncbi:exodeoxyribonuclease VII small subunit [bacterium]|jgi:exodeoxyribonuclease VII small subunit|nr:exodeoxyribonuclease VII small subunit [bacterium]